MPSMVPGARVRYPGLVLVAASLIGALLPASARANGRHGETTHLSGLATGEGIALRLDTTVDALSFIRTLGGKYHLLRIMITNGGRAPVALARATTSAEVRVPYESGAKTKTVHAIVDLGKHDPALWSRLPAWQRSVFRFPEQIGAGETDSMILAVAASEVPPEPDPRLVTIRIELPGNVSATLRLPAVQAR